MELTKELLAKAKETQTAEELLALAKENGMELTQEEAEKYYAKLHQTGELADEELDNVAGGGCSSKLECPECHNTDLIYCSGSGSFSCPRCGKITTLGWA